MNNRTFVVLIVGLVILLAIILSSFRLKKKELIGDNLSFQVNKSGRCETVKIHEMESFDVYTYCVDEIFISDGDTKITLEEYLKSNKEVAIDNIIKNLTHDWAMYDGGTEKFKNSEISLIKCRRLDKREDVYIGIPDMELEDNYCNNEK